MVMMCFRWPQLKYDTATDQHFNPYNWDLPQFEVCDYKISVLMKHILKGLNVFQDTVY